MLYRVLLTDMKSSAYIRELRIGTGVFRNCFSLTVKGRATVFSYKLAERFCRKMNVVRGRREINRYVMEAVEWQAESNS